MDESASAAPSSMPSSANPLALFESEPPVEPPVEAAQADASRSRTTTRADVEAAKEAAGSDLMSQRELIEVVDTYFEEEMQQLRSEFTTTAKLEKLIFSVHARLTEAPTNWHQAAIFAMSTKDPVDADLSARAGILFVMGLAMVMMQCITVVGVFQGILYPSCGSNDQCSVEGQFCGMKARMPRGENCWYCGTYAPLDFQMDPDGVGSWNFPEDQGGHRGFNRTHALEVCNNPGTLSVQAKPPPGRGNHPMFPSAICKEYTDEYNWVTTPCKYETELGVPSQYAMDYVEAWCDRCVNPMTGDVDGLTAWSRPALNIQAMGLADYVTYFFASIIVAMTMCGELKDIMLCKQAMEKWSDSLSTSQKIAQHALNGLRIWVFLPTMQLTIMTLVVFNGGDALTVCFNTVAMLFMCEIDNFAYASALPENIRARVEAAGRCDLTGPHQKALTWSKVVMLLSVPAAIMLPLPLMGTGVQSLFLLANVVPFLAYLISVYLMEFGPGSRGSEKCCGGHSGPGDVAKHAGWVFLKNVLGLIGFGIFLGIASI